jgi:hypothetical protein
MPCAGTVCCSGPGRDGNGLKSRPPLVFEARHADLPAQELERTPTEG